VDKMSWSNLMSKFTFQTSRKYTISTNDRNNKMNKIW
jgi:hypothetical protein